MENIKKEKTTHFERNQHYRLFATTQSDASPTITEQFEKQEHPHNNRYEKAYGVI